MNIGQNTAPPAQSPLHTGVARPRGYQRLANLMAVFPETAVVRRFKSLTMLHILGLQAGLVDLQNELDDICKEDRLWGDTVTRSFPDSFFAMRQSCKEDPDNQLQYHRLMEIRQKLLEYNSAFLQAVQMAKLDTPGLTNIQALQNRLEGDEQGEDFLRDGEVSTWAHQLDVTPGEKKRFDQDFLTIANNIVEQDVFSRALSTTIIDWWIRTRSLTKRIKAKYTTKASSQPDTGQPVIFVTRKTLDLRSGVLHYNDDHLYRINNIVVSVISSALPVLAIVALQYLKTPARRFGVMAAFSFTFALALATFSNARRLEIFASTAAYVSCRDIMFKSRS